MFTHGAVNPLGHARHEFLYQEVGRPQIEVDVFVEERVVGVGRCREPVDAGIVDQDVDRTRLVGQPADVVGPRQVGGHKACAPAVVFDRLHRLGAPFGAAAMHHDLRAQRGQLLGDRPADTRRRPGDQCG